MTAREVAIDPRGIAHAVAWGITTRPGELITECGVRARWRRLTLWWSPLVMNDPVDCMTCLVVEARQ